jgi:hypothetical protein
MSILEKTTNLACHMSERYSLLLIVGWIWLWLFVLAPVRLLADDCTDQGNCKNVPRKTEVAQGLGGTLVGVEGARRLRKMAKDKQKKEEEDKVITEDDPGLGSAGPQQSEPTQPGQDSIKPDSQKITAEGGDSVFGADRPDSSTPATDGDGLPPPPRPGSGPAVPGGSTSSLPNGTDDPDGLPTNELPGAPPQGGDGTD